VTIGDTVLTGRLWDNSTARDLIWNRKINPGKVFDLTLPLEQVAEGYCAMDERRAIKALLLP
jgi:threonine dehydrogenase-like Zn-dependent dehydrogenase